MYEKFFGLTEKPFGVTPDPRFLFLSSHHREALAYLRYGIQERTGFVAIIGEVGTGKTTLLHALLNGLEPGTKTAFIFNTSLTAKGLLRMMVSDFGIRSNAQTKTELLLEIHQFLLRQYASGAKCVLVVDEAQNLNFRLLEEIRLLSNLETDRDKLLDIILVGQPELATKLANPRMRQLRQRISARYGIVPLTSEETGRYIAHRLKVAGLSGEALFSSQAVEEIYHWSKGVPRLINVICDRAMLLGYARELRHVDLSLVQQAIGDLAAQGVLQTPPDWPQHFLQPDANDSFRIPWHQRAWRYLTVTSGLLLSATLFSLPLDSGEPESDLSTAVVHSMEMSWPVALEPGEEEIPIVDNLSGCQPSSGAALQVELEKCSYSVHVASFRQVSMAERYSRALQSDGHLPTFIVPIELAESGQWYRVMVGRFRSQAAALQVAQGYLTRGIFPYAQPRPLMFPQEELPQGQSLEEVVNVEMTSSEGVGHE